MKAFSHIAIIYNPNSTGPGEQNARTLQQDLLHYVKKTTDILLIPTEFEKHAEEIAHNIAKKHPNCMIISSSGDGGYHEVINGVLSLEKHGTAVTGLLPSGNANDHFNAIHQSHLYKRISNRDVKMIDILRVRTYHNGKKWQRYAHSYVGLGLTPAIGDELNKTKINKLSEIYIVAKGLLSRHSQKIVVDHKAVRYEHLVISTISRMSKYLRLSSSASITDGLFEITSLRGSSTPRLLRFLLKSSLQFPPSTRKQKEFTFTTTSKLSLQLDGEIYHFLPHTTITVECMQEELGCII